MFILKRSRTMRLTPAPSTQPPPHFSPPPPLSDPAADMDNLDCL